MGDTLARLLNREIDDLAESEDVDRSEIISRLATAAGIDESTVGQILRGEIECPPMERIEGFAEVLPRDVTIERLRRALRADGCNVEEDGD